MLQIEKILYIFNDFYLFNFRAIFDIRGGRMDRWSGENRYIVDRRAGVVGEKEKIE